MQRLNRERLVKLVKNGKTGKYQPSINDVVFWYDTLNEHVFDNDLPKLTGIRFCQSKDYWGQIECGRYKRDNTLRSNLILSNDFPSFKDFVEVMAHEMVHIWEYEHYSIMGHGERFFMWESKLKKLGLRLLIAQ